MMKIKMLMETLGHANIIVTRNWCHKNGIKIIWIAEVELVETSFLHLTPEFQEKNI